MPGAQRTLIVIGGPTASGKTHVAASVAKHLGTEVISADSRQFYHAMRIGTARPREEELLGVKHHFLGHLELQQAWSAGDFAREAEPVLQELLTHHGVAVMVGGSGLYIDAVCHGLDPLPRSDQRVRTELRTRMQQEGLDALIEQLRILDHETWATIDRNNPHRVIRALEICLVSQQPASAQRTSGKQRTDMRIIRIALDLPRTELYGRIDARVDRMIAEGSENEARSLLPYRDLNALRTVGYTEFFAHFDGAMDLERTVGLIKQHTRNYAKRQLTWLRRDSTWHREPPDPFAVIARIDGIH